MGDLAKRLARGEVAAFAELYDLCADRLHQSRRSGEGGCPHVLGTVPPAPPRPRRHHGELQAMKRPWRPLKIAALRAAGEPTTLADLCRQPIPPESNAMTYLDQAAPAVEAIESAVYAVEEQATEEERQAVGDDRPSPAILTAMRDALAAHPDVVPLLERVAAYRESLRSERAPAGQPRPTGRSNARPRQRRTAPHQENAARVADLRRGSEPDGRRRPAGR